MTLDWEDYNKEAFVAIVQMRLIKSETSEQECARILYEAYRVKKGGIPCNLLLAAQEFLIWQHDLGRRPAWVQHAVGGIA